MKDPNPILAVRNLEISFPGNGGMLPLVSELSLDLQRGRTLGLVGESGCGKTLTSLSILGLTPAPGQVTGGEILYAGTNLVNKSERELDKYRGDRIAMIFQEPMTALNPVFTVGSQIAEVLIVHRGFSNAVAWDKVVQMLDRVGIPDAAKRAHAYPHQLSGGMRQRAMIAMAMVTEPDVLIADEPTTALDVTIQAQILDLMLEMQAALGTAILFITHDLGVVSELADDIAVMYAGKVVETGPARQVLSTPQHPYTRALIETLPASAKPGSRLPTIEGMVPDLATLPTGCRFADRCNRVLDDCRMAQPELESAGDNQLAACFHLGAGQ